MFYDAPDKALAAPEDYSTIQGSQRPEATSLPFVVTCEAKILPRVLRDGTGVGNAAPHVVERVALAIISDVQPVLPAAQLPGGTLPKQQARANREKTRLCVVVP